jgi:FkbM family methyltransferase
MNFSLRRIFEQSTRSWVFRRRLPAAFGGAQLYVSPSAGLRYLVKSIGNVDETLLRNAIELVRPGDVVWDIGANVGLFSFAAAALAGPAGQIVSFEADVWLAALLHRSRRLQGPNSAPITIIAAAVASGNTLRKFQIAKRSRSSNALAGYGLSETGGFTEAYLVPTFKLDYLLDQMPRPNVLKCDVEGAELEVFLDQTELLEQARPTILCEVSANNNRVLTTLWRSHRYRLCNAELPLSPASEIDHSAWNTIAIPEEKVSQYFQESAALQSVALSDAAETRP